MTRNQEHKYIVYSLYAIIVRREHGIDFDIPDIMEGIFNIDFEDISDFSKKVVINCFKHETEIVEQIAQNLKKWKYERLNYVAQAIFLMSFAENKYIDEPLDKGIVINNAVRFAKEFLDATDYKFINAILNKVL